MERDSKRRYVARGSALVAIVAVHGLIIAALMAHTFTLRSALSPASILVIIVDKPVRLPVDLRLPTPQLSRSRAILLPESMPDISVPIYAEPPPSLQVIDSEQIASNAAGAASLTNGAAKGAGGSNVLGGENNIPVIFSVPPIYPPASVSAREQGNVVVQVLVDKRGHAKEIEVIRSSGFGRLDESTVVAIRQWRFAPTNGSEVPEARTTIKMEFQLTPPSLSVPVAVMPFDAAMARRIQLAASPNIEPYVPTPPTARALNKLIKKIQSFELSVNSPSGPIPPVRLLASWGEVSSIQFRGNASHGMDIEFEQNIRDKEDLHWERYEVKQIRGASEWLIAVNRNGAIKDAQAMICAPVQDSEISCPWP